MDLEETESLLRNNNYCAYGRHDLLFSMSYVIEYEDGEAEVLFAVPAEFLRDWLSKKTGHMWTFARVQKWLQEEYTSEDSEEVLQKAALDDKIAFYNIDYRDVIPF